MKKILIISITLLTITFSISQAQVLSCREVKEWALALFEQNKDLHLKNLAKDTVIQKQDTLISGQQIRIASYQNDSTIYISESKAYKESIANRNEVITILQDKIKKRTVIWGGSTALFLLLLVISLL